MDVAGGPLEHLLFDNAGSIANIFPSLSIPRSGRLVAWWHYSIFSEECRLFASVWRATGVTDVYKLIGRTELASDTIGEHVSLIDLDGRRVNMLVLMMSLCIGSWLHLGNGWIYRAGIHLTLSIGGHV